MGVETEYQDEPGRVVVKPLLDEDENWYWHAFVGDMRINGGMVTRYADGMMEGQRAISVWRKNYFYKNFYYDVETQKWIRKGTLPPV